MNIPVLARAGNLPDLVRSFRIVFSGPAPRVVIDKSRAEESDVEIDDTRRSESNQKYIVETRGNIVTQLLEKSLPLQHVYLMSYSSSKLFRNAYSSFGGGPTYNGIPIFIDEMKLIHDLIEVNRRREAGSQDDIQQDVRCHIVYLINKIVA